MKGYLVSKGAEIFSVKTYEKTIDFFDGEVKSIEVNNISSYKVKLKSNDKFVTLETNNIFNEEEIYNELVENSSIVESSEDSKFAKESIVNKAQTNYELSNEEVIDFFKKISQIKNPYMKSLRIVYSYKKNTYNLTNLVAASSDENNCNNFEVVLTMQNDENIITQYADILKNKVDFNEIENYLVKMIENNAERLIKKEIKTSSSKVLLEGLVVGKIMEQLSSMFFGENIKNSLSALDGKLNEQIFGKNITIIEDPLHKNAIMPRAFDNEGSKKDKQIIVENGVFLKMLHNNKTAKIFNELSTGNSEVTRNLYIVPGENDLLENFKDGIIITNIEGAHSGINNITGAISVQARGYIVNNYEKAASENLILTTNIFEILNNTLEIDKNCEVLSSQISMPSLLLENISVVVGD